jgi:hypothetical protein
MKPTLRAILITTMEVAFGGTALPQDIPKPEYLRDDIAGAAMIGKLMPLEKQTLQSILAAVGGGEPDQNDETGFGGQIFDFRRGHGYTAVTVRGFASNGRLAWVRVGVESYSPNWQDIRERVMKSWEAAGGPVYRCEQNECFSEWKEDQVLAAYRQAVALQLGPPNNVPVPDTLKKHYEYLMSPFETTLIGPGACGLPMPDEPLRPLPGREGINSLVEARRVDLIVNVLRGYNPGARIYALLALRRLQRDGLPISAGVAATMRKVQNLKAPVSTCFGCIVNRGLLGNDVVKLWRDHER